jgi:flagellin-like hook-associated protein FlgL
MTDITLTSSARSSLISLQQTADLSARTQGRLTTGKKVNSVLDNAISFFQAQGLSNRASDLTNRKDSIDQGLSSLQSSLRGAQSTVTLLTTLRGIVSNAQTQSVSQRSSATTSFKEVARQLVQLVRDTSYQGLNLLNSTKSKLSVQFSERTASILNVQGFKFDATTANTRGVFTGVVAFSGAGSLIFSNVIFSKGFSNINGANNSLAGSRFTTLLQRLDAAITKVQNQTATLGVNVSILQTRLDFTKSYTNDLQQGSDKLTLADLNEEGANLTALNTRQQLGIQSLSVAGQQQQAILQLLR